MARTALPLDVQAERAQTALTALLNARSTTDRLVAAQALESAACQIRRACKREASA